jgi:hypothetical protein
MAVRLGLPLRLVRASGAMVASPMPARGSGFKPRQGQGLAPHSKVNGRETIYWQMLFECSRQTHWTSITIFWTCWNVWIWCKGDNLLADAFLMLSSDTVALLEMT